MMEAHPKDFGDEFHIKIYASEGEFENSDFFGEVFCKWKEAIKKPNEYAVKGNFEVTDNHNQ